MNIPGNLKYTENDEWLKFSKQVGTVGITDYAQEQLSDIVYVDIIVSVGDEITVNDQIATIESVKAAADVYAPVSGTIISINESLLDQPELLNKDAYGQGWIITINLSDDAQVNLLLDPNSYESKIKAKE